MSEEPIRQRNTYIFWDTAELFSWVAGLGPELWNKGWLDTDAP